MQTQSFTHTLPYGTPNQCYPQNIPTFHTFSEHTTFVPPVCPSRNQVATLYQPISPLTNQPRSFIGPVGVQNIYYPLQPNIQIDQRNNGISGAKVAFGTAVFCISVSILIFAVKTLVGF